jgi:hypothetical protein
MFSEQAALIMAREQRKEMLQEAERERLLQALAFQQPGKWRNKMYRTILYLSIIVILLALAFGISAQPTSAHGEKPHVEQAISLNGEEQAMPKKDPNIPALSMTHTSVITSSRPTIMLTQLGPLRLRLMSQKPI